MKRLGERIKKKRELLHLQLNDLAKRVGISASALSQIEKAKAFPSIVTLKNIAENLHTTVGDLIGENEMLSQNPLMTVSDRKFVETNAGGSELYLLSHHDPLKQMETYLIRFKRGSDISDFFAPHAGQVFCQVLQGVFRFLLDGEPYLLQPGDSFYFNTVLEHEVQLAEGESGELLWVVTPPSA
ncbi:MAG: helix-turn-helix domain-containing protein [Mangrovibacterium sp.]